MGWTGRAPAPPAREVLVRGTKAKEHAMAEALANAIAFVGIDIGGDAAPRSVADALPAVPS